LSPFWCTDALKAERLLENPRRGGKNFVPTVFWQETAVISERIEMTIRNEHIDSLLIDYKKPKGLIGESGLLKQLTQRLVARQGSFTAGRVMALPLLNPAQ
jgi:hypothetical protein